MANAPHPPRDGRSYADDLPGKLSKIFLQMGLDRLLVICPSCQLVAPDDVISSLQARQNQSCFLYAAMDCFAHDDGWIQPACDERA